ncbi:unnamed protein product, partial [Leptidea sinapis]
VEPPLFAGQPVLTGEPLLTGESVLTGKPVLTGDDMTEEVPTHETDPLTPKQRRNTTLILLRNDLGEDTPEIQHRTAADFEGYTSVRLGNCSRSEVLRMKKKKL